MNELKILVVDDESRMRKLVKDFLTRAGYQVLEAQDGEEAVDTFYSTKGINLLVLDVMMPKMDGWEVVKEIRKVSKVPINPVPRAGHAEDAQVVGGSRGVEHLVVMGAVALPGPADEVVASGGRGVGVIVGSVEHEK